MSTIDVAAIEPSEVSTVSWGAVIAGGVTSAALTLLLAALGVGLGLSSISPWADSGVSATTFEVGSGVYLLAVSMLAFTVGGYLTGRLRAKWVGVHDHEVYFRDSAHGLLVWALATVISAGALGAATTLILSGAAAGTVGVASRAAPVNPTDTYVDTLLRANPAAAAAPAPAAAASPSASAPAPAQTPAASDLAATRGELGRLISPSLQRRGDLSPADRTYAARVVAARTGLSQAEADKRVADVIAQAKKTADDARKAAAKLALWLAASLLAGALAAMLGAIEGGLLRDSKWYEAGWRHTIVRSHI